jgi:hypothetical protein
MLATEMASPRVTEFQLPKKDDVLLQNVIHECAELFKSFTRCSKRAMLSAKESNEYLDLMHQLDKEFPQGVPDPLPTISAKRLKRRADNVLIMAMVRECGYVRTPLKDCVATTACNQHSEERDQYLASRPDLISIAKKIGTTPESKDELSKHQQNEMAKVALFERNINECVRRYQFAMNVAYISQTGTFDINKMDNVEIEIIKPGQL